MLAFLADTLARWGAMMQRPLHEPVPVASAPSREWAWGVPGAFENRAEWLAEFDARNAIARVVFLARATVALLPSTDYRTNPRPSQVPVEAPAPTLDALRAGLLARGPRGDALRAAVVRATVGDL